MDLPSKNDGKDSSEDLDKNGVILAKRLKKGDLEYRFESTEFETPNWTKRSALLNIDPLLVREAEMKRFLEKKRKLFVEKQKRKMDLLNERSVKQERSVTDTEIEEKLKRKEKKRELRYTKYFFSDICRRMRCVESHLTKGANDDKVTKGEKKTGLAFDVNCLFHFGNPDEPENPERYEAGLTSLTESKLKNRCIPVLGELDLNKVVKLIRTAHSESLLNELLTLNKDIENQILKSNETESYYAGMYTAKAVLWAISHSSKLTKLVSDGKLNNGFCFIRPPGHHCDFDRTFGFCHANNIAISAKIILNANPNAKILIYDWDLHHGNGTEDIFYNESNVLYISTHQEFDDSGRPMFPGTGNPDDIGGRKSRGTNLNIPVPIGCGDSEYRTLLDYIIIPVLKEFQPDIVLVSAGFDSCIGDPLGLLQISPQMFAYMTRRLMNAQSNGKLVLFLEGGYKPSNVSECSSACVSALLGDPVEYNPQPSQEEDFAIYLNGIIQGQKLYWKSLNDSKPLEELSTTKQSLKRYLPSQNGLLRKRRVPPPKTQRLVALKSFRTLHPDMNLGSSDVSDSGSSFIANSDMSRDNSADEYRVKKPKDRHAKMMRKRARRALKREGGGSEVSQRSGLRLVSKSNNVGEVINLTEENDEEKVIEAVMNDAGLTTEKPPSFNGDFGEIAEENGTERLKSRNNIIELMSESSNNSNTEDKKSSDDSGDNEISFEVKDGVIIMD